jgi:hypothetical protein
MGTFGSVTVRVPRARLETSDGKTAEWKNDHSGLPAAHQTGRRADRWRLSCRDQPAAGQPGARGTRSTGMIAATALAARPTAIGVENC